MATSVIELRTADVRALHLGGTGLETLRALPGAQARALGHDRGADFAFLAVASAGVVREFVYLPVEKALIEFDVVDSATGAKWKLQGGGSAQSLLDTQTQLLHLIQLGEQQKAGKIDSDDLAGLRLRSWGILFYTEPRMARSAVSFDVEGPSRMKFLIAGLAPGAWEIWRAGMRELEDGAVAPESGLLCFQGKPGSYFLRSV
jgi:hypothetical protein